MYHLTTENRKDSVNGLFTEYSFLINNTVGFYELSDYLFYNKISKNDIIKIRISGKDPFDFANKIASITNAPMAFCNFIRNCRQGINGYPNDGTFKYPKEYSIVNMANQTAEYLTINTGINFCFERVANAYHIDLSNLETIEQVVNKVNISFITNSVSAGDTVTLKLKDSNLNYLIQVLYYLAIVQAANFVRDAYQIPTISSELPKTQFVESEIAKCNLPSLLTKETGIFFQLALAS